MANNIDLSSAIDDFQNAIYGKDVRAALVEVAEAVEDAVNDQLITLDTALSESGKGADAKAVGDLAMINRQISLSAGDDLDDYTAPGVYFVPSTVIDSIVNRPDEFTAGGTLTVLASGTDRIVQMLHSVTNVVYIRRVGYDWDRIAVSAISAFTTATSADTLLEDGFYQVPLASVSGRDDTGLPVRQSGALIVMSGQPTYARSVQIFATTSAVYMRLYANSAWGAWNFCANPFKATLMYNEGVLEDDRSVNQVIDPALYYVPADATSQPEGWPVKGSALRNGYLAVFGTAGYANKVQLVIGSDQQIYWRLVSATGFGEFQTALPYFELARTAFLGRSHAMQDLTNSQNTIEGTANNPGIVAVARSYYTQGQRETTYGKFTMRYGYDTALSSAFDGYDIDCSTFIGLILRGIPYEASPYADSAPISTTPSGDDDDAPDEEEYYKPTLTLGSMPWVVNPSASSIRTAMVEPWYILPIRTAAQIGQWMVLQGLSIDPGDGMQDLQPGDIVFYARKENGDWKQPNRYLHINHVGIVSSTIPKSDLTNDDNGILWSTSGTSWASDYSDYPYDNAHEMYMVSAETSTHPSPVYRWFAEQSWNTNPREDGNNIHTICLVCRPDLGEMTDGKLAEIEARLAALEGA